MFHTRTLVLLVAGAGLLASGCSDRKAKQSAGSGSAAAGATADVGVISIDGSSTVFPISQAVAEEFQKTSRTRVTVAMSGTGGGFKKFCRGELEVTGASRPIKKTEMEACAAAGIEFIEIPVAYDGLAVVVNKDNTWVESLTVAELKKMWEPAAQGKLTNWNQIREGFPDAPLRLLGPGVDSGTYDYFTAAITGTEHSSRGDFIASEDDNVLVQGVAGDKNALGFFGYAYFVENADKLKLIAVDDGNPDNGNGPIAPSLETVANGTYQPLARPIFIYVSKNAASAPSVAAFIDYYLKEGAMLTKEVGYIPLPDKAYSLAAERFTKRATGSLFADGSKIGVTVEELLSQTE